MGSSETKLAEAGRIRRCFRRAGQKTQPGSMIKIIIAPSYSLVQADIHIGDITFDSINPNIYSVRRPNLDNMGSLDPSFDSPLGLIVSSMNICRVPGDVGNVHTFDFPVIQVTAKDSLMVRMVSDGEYDEEFLNNFVQAGKELVDRGAVGIITSCGFLANAQK